MVELSLVKSYLQIDIDDDDVLIQQFIAQATDRVNGFLNTEYDEEAPAAVKGCVLNLVQHYYDNRGNLKSKRVDGLQTNDYRSEKEILEAIIDYRRSPWLDNDTD